MQLQLFNEPMFRNDYEFLLEKYERLRKSQHARISVLQKEVKEIKEKLEFLESNICKGIVQFQQAM